jgi:hypothetical protein
LWNRCFLSSFSADFDYGRSKSEVDGRWLQQLRQDQKALGHLSDEVKRSPQREHSDLEQEEPS